MKEAKIPAVNQTIAKGNNMPINHINTNDPFRVQAFCRRYSEAVGVDDYEREVAEVPEARQQKEDSEAEEQRTSNCRFGGPRTSRAAARHSPQVPEGTEILHHMGSSVAIQGAKCQNKWKAAGTRSKSFGRAWTAGKTGGRWASLAGCK